LHTDASLRFGTTEARAHIVNNLLRRNQDSALADELDAVFRDGKLLGVGTRGNDNRITARGLVDSFLDTLVVADVDSVAMAVLPAISIFGGIVVLKVTAILIFIIALGFIPGCRS
jgi:hypothetical protein